MGDGGWRGRLGPSIGIAPGARVDKFEIFFDLVFVFSFFNIARSTAANLNGAGMLHALLVLAVLWWCWVVHTVVATRIRIGEGFVPVLMVAGMAALFSFAVAMPQAFVNSRENETGPIVVAVSYVVIRAVHLALFLHIVRDNPTERRQLRRYAPELTLSTVLLLVAALLPAHLHDMGTAHLVRDALWMTVVLLQYGTGLFARTWGWGVTSAEHWTERYDLILIIALGESVISVGLGSDLLNQPATWPGVTAGVLGIVLTAALWWVHYDMIGPAARIALHATLGRARMLMARDAYAYLYLLMITGIITFALGAEGIVHDVAEPGVPLGEPAHGPDVPMMFGGVLLYLLGSMLFQLRTLGTLTWLRVGTLIALAVGIPVARQMPALAALGLVTAICVGLVFAEVVLMSEARQALRTAVFEERTAHEAHEAAYRARWHGQPPGTT
ncbi:low temperature requirement protein A [Micromonospora sp. DT48]|uniref:low temperature requirement protein A n=1 Tax=unclassified Micromonospora TaxID=2617518 RepID=UPI00132B880F|nr:low temperature requirement protein A [Micromonospora sp. CP22]MTK03772.1 low temperature requirement protein A [Micromonospora sp. CP22]